MAVLSHFGDQHPRPAPLGGAKALDFFGNSHPFLVFFVVATIHAGYASVLGFVALAGVVVNDSLVLVDFINQERAEGMPLREAIEKSGSLRFRPILLTSLTTFAGLLPVLFETSLQAQFLIPMAISLSFGVLFATVITLLLVPAFYSILEDIREASLRFFKRHS